MGRRRTQRDEKRSCSATTIAGSAALPFVISTGAQRSGEICGVSGPFLEMFFDRAYPGFLLRVVSNVHVRSHWAFGPPKAMKSGSCSATTLNGSAALPFVISTGAPKERSGEICGVSDPFLEMCFDRGDEKRVLFSSYCCWKRRPPLCHLDRRSHGPSAHPR